MEVLQRLWFVYKVVKLVFYIGMALVVGLVSVLLVQISSFVTGQYYNADGDIEANCIRDYLRRRPPDNSVFIPMHIHQIYFSINNVSLPKVWDVAAETWRDDNPDCKYSLWDEEKFCALLKAKYPELVRIYGDYDDWVSRVDVAKLVILHFFGGVYVDMDTRSRKSITPLFYAVSRRYDAVLYKTLPLGVASDFIMAKTGSHFVAHALCGLKSAQRQYLLPYFTDMLSAGPLFLYIRYLVYGRQSDVKLLEEDEVSRFVRHIDGRTWHQWDGALLWWIFYNRHLLVAVFVSLFGAFLFYKFYTRRRCVGSKACQRNSRPVHAQ